MSDIKTPAEIETMRIGGKILSDVLWEVMAAAKPGVSELELDSLAERRIRERGGEPGFMKVPGYHHTVCFCTNEVVVHGIPSDYRLKAGDVVCIDCGVFYGGFHTDMAETIVVQSAEGEGLPAGKAGQSVEKKKFLDTGKRALEAGIAQATLGNRIGHISRAIQDIVEKDGGYSIIRTLVGHGVGKELHEPPEVPGFLDRAVEKTPLLKTGMTLAIEVIYTMGGPEVVYKGNDDWTIISKDGSLSSVFERTIVIAEQGPEILTP